MTKLTNLQRLQYRMDQLDIKVDACQLVADPRVYVRERAAYVRRPGRAHGSWCDQIDDAISALTDEDLLDLQLEHLKRAITATPEGGIEMKPQSLTKQQRSRFKEIELAVKNGHAAVVAAVDANGTPVALVCSCVPQESSYLVRPLAILLEDADATQEMELAYKDIKSERMGNT